MKKLYTLIICFTIATAMKAQPVLNSSEMLPFNSQCNYLHPDGFAVIDTNIQGANRTWNFQALTPDNSQGTYQMNILHPASTPYGGLYPSSNYCLKEMPGSTYNYYNLTSSTWERLGSVETDTSHYSNTQVELVYPLQLGTINNDTWEYDGSSFPGDYNINCIGSGSLVLPNITYPNTLLVRAELINSFLDIMVYFWYNADNGAVLLQYIPGDGFIVPEAAVYLVSMSIGIEENEVPYTVNYNNPVEDKLSITMVSNQNAIMDYTVVNLLGDVLGQSTFRAVAQQASKLEVDFSSYAPGIYFIRFVNESGGSENVKAIKIMKR